MRHERAMRGITSADLGRSADVAKTLMSMGICGEDTRIMRYQKVEKQRSWEAEADAVIV